jgi:hypothetical protein
MCFINSPRFIPRVWSMARVSYCVLALMTLTDGAPRDYGARHSQAQRMMMAIASKRVQLDAY